MQTLENICTTVLWLGWRKVVLRGSKIWFGLGNKNTCLGRIKTRFVSWMLPDHHILLNSSPIPVLSLNLLLDLIMRFRIIWVKLPGLLLVTSSNKDCYLASNFQEKAMIRGNQYIYFYRLVNNSTSSLIYLAIPSGGPDCFFNANTEHKDAPSDSVSPCQGLGHLGSSGIILLVLWGLCPSVSLPGLLRWSHHYHTLNASHHTLRFLWHAIHLPNGPVGCGRPVITCAHLFLCVCCVYLCYHRLDRKVHLKSSVCDPVVSSCYPCNWVCLCLWPWQW